MTALLTEGRAHDAAMTKGPWERDPIALKRDPNTPYIVDGNGHTTMRALGSGDAAGIAWMRNNLSALLDAAEERDRLKAEVERLRDRIPPCGYSGVSWILAPGAEGRCPCGAWVKTTDRCEIPRHFPHEAPHG